MADVYKQSFKQNYTNNIELPSSIAASNAVLRAKHGGRVSATIT